MKPRVRYMSGDEIVTWLETQVGTNLVSDDYGRWAISDSGTQPVPEEEPTDMWITSFVDAPFWQPSIREAVEYYLSNKD